MSRVEQAIEPRSSRSTLSTPPSFQARDGWQLGMEPDQIQKDISDPALYPIIFSQI